MEETVEKQKIRHEIVKEKCGYYFIEGYIRAAPKQRGKNKHICYRRDGRYWKEGKNWKEGKL